MGLLDWTEQNPALTQGLLAAAFGAMAGRGTRLQALGQGGITGLLGYSNAQGRMADAEKEKEAAKMRQMQMGMLEQQLAQQKTDQDALRDVMAPVSGPQAMAGGGGPTMANAEKVGQVPKFDPGAMLARGASPQAVQQAIQLQQSMNPRTKVKEFREIRTPNGVEVVGFDEYGQPVNTGQTPFMKPEVRDFGNYVGGIDPVTGKVARYGDKGVSPDAVLGSNTTRRGQDIKAATDRDFNDVQRQLLIQERGLKVAELQDKAEDRKVAKEGRVASIGSQIGVIDKALSHPGRETSTGLTGALDPRNYIPGTSAADFRSVLDQINGSAFLQAFEGLRGGGQITQVEGEKATQAIARLNRAQSDEEFKKSLNELRGIMTTGYERLSGQKYPALNSNGWSATKVP